MNNPQTSEIILKQIPIGPSINEIYKPIRGRFVKGESGRIYDKKIQAYKLRNFRILQQAHEMFKGHTLCVDKYFVFHNKRLYCKDGSIKKIDVENFLKSSIDGLAELLGIDDKMFKSGITEAVSCEKEEQQQLIVKITLHKMRTYEELTGILNLALPIVTNQVSP